MGQDGCVVMHHRKISVLLALTLLTGLLLAACSSGSGVEKNQFEVGDKVASYWFDFTVDQVDTMESYGDYWAQDGWQLVMCRLTIKNTFDQDVSMGWADFILKWEDQQEDTAGSEPVEMAGAYALPQYTKSQFPDEYTLKEDEEVQGVLVYEVPKQVSRAAVVFQELYASGDSESEYTEGSSYYVWTDLG